MTEQLALIAEPLLTETSAALTGWRHRLLRWHKAYPAFRATPDVQGCGRPPSAFGMEGPPTPQQVEYARQAGLHVARVAAWERTRP